jgi:16S rRNA G966 N2-methylase RsmD
MSLLDIFEELESLDPLKVCCTYQGNKWKLKEKILEIIQPVKSERFYDLCCGSGAISLELINRGWNPKDITMLDSGPWGIVWESIGKCTLDYDKLYDLASDVLRNNFDSKILKLANGTISPESFLILQSVSFGGKAIWIENNKFKHHNFIKENTPTIYVTAKKRIENMLEVVQAYLIPLKGINGHCLDISSFKVESGKVYIDPPYASTLKYGNNFNVLNIISNFKVPCFVSESEPLGTNAYFLGYRNASRMNGSNVSRSEEWITAFNME